MGRSLGSSKRLISSRQSDRKNQMNTYEQMFFNKQKVPNQKYGQMVNFGAYQDEIPKTEAANPEGTFKSAKQSIRGHSDFIPLAPGEATQNRMKPPALPEASASKTGFGVNNELGDLS